MQHNVSLAAFDGSDFDKGAGIIKITLWYFVNALIVRASWNPFMRIKVMMLRAFRRTDWQRSCHKEQCYGKISVEAGHRRRLLAWRRLLDRQPRQGDDRQQRLHLTRSDAVDGKS